MGGFSAETNHVHTVPFAVTVSPERVDPDLAEKLRGELPAILAWALDGLKAYQAGGFARLMLC